MAKKSLFDDNVYREVTDRINRLEPGSEPEWGEMSVGQMLAHCAEVTEVGNGKELEGTPFIFKLVGPLVKKLLVSEKPFPRASRTHPQYIITDPKDFEEQRARLLQSLEKMRADGPVARKHPAFGNMSAEERGWSNYKHLDHHLQQFGV